MTTDAEQGPDTDEPPRRLFYAQCRISDREGFAADIVDTEPRGLNDPRDIVRVYRTLDGGANWSEIGMQRSWRAAIKTLLYSGDWPPSTIESLDWHQGRLRLRYRDEWIVDEKYCYEWDAYYSPERRRWSLRIVRKLDHSAPPFVYPIPETYRADG